MTALSGEFTCCTTVPDGKSTVNGFQSPQNINLFQSPTGKIAHLKSIIVNEIEAYYLKFKSQQCRYIHPQIENHLHFLQITII